MAAQPETRLCHVLTGEQGLRAYEAGLLNPSDRVAGFHAMVWKCDGDSDFKRDLSVDFNGNKIKRLLLKSKLPPKTAALIEIRWPPVAPASSWESKRTEMLRYIGPSSDPQMIELEGMLRQPKARHELSLGRFERNDQLGWIEAEIAWMGQPIRASIEAQLDVDVPDQETLLAALLLNQAEWDAKARKAIISGLYELWRDGWRQDDPILTEAEFANRMKMESIQIQRGGGFDFWFNDADLFWGHGILVSGTIDGGFEPAEMHG